MGSMSEKRKADGLYWTMAVLAAVVLSLTLYFLSVGPAYWIRCNEWISAEPYAAYCAPAWYVVNLIGAHDPYERYVRWWTP